MPNEPTRPDPAAAPPAVPVSELLARIAAERGLDFEPAPDAVTAALPGLLRTVDELAASLGDVQQRRWLAAALTTLSDHVQAATLSEPADVNGSPNAGGVAVAVVTAPSGVLAGRRRDGIPRWVFPGGSIEDGETPAEAAVRECVEETGLHVTAGEVIGQRVHPVTSQPITYVACTPAHDTTTVRVAAPDELVEVRWLRHDQVAEVMPGLHDPVRDHLAQCAADEPER